MEDKTLKTVKNRIGKGVVNLNYGKSCTKSNVNDMQSRHRTGKEQEHRKLEKRRYASYWKKKSSTPKEKNSKRSKGIRVQTKRNNLRTGNLHEES